MATPDFMTRPERWDVPFGADMSDRDVDRLLAIEPFAGIDTSRFPANLLRDILRNDTRIVRYRHGDIILREGSFGDSAFLVLTGAVRVTLQSVDPALLGRRLPKKKSFLSAVAQRWTNPRNVEVRNMRDY